MFEVTYKLTDFFFDRAEVQNRLAKRERRAMSKIGAFVRTSARTSLKRRKAVSPAGSPPSVHSKDKVATLKNILFGYDPTKHSVVVGAVGLNQVNREASIQASRPVPAIMEFGGTVAIQEERWKRIGGSERWYRRDLRRLPSESKLYRVRIATYEPRPFMAPALERERKNDKLLEAWKDLL